MGDSVLNSLTRPTDGESSGLTYATLSTRVIGPGLALLLLACSSPQPRDVGVRDEINSPVCVGTGGPSVMVEVRDSRGRPAAIGTTIVIQEGTFKDSVDGAHAISELHVGAGERRPGRYEVRLYKPGYKPVILRDVMAPGDTRCRYAEPTDIRKVTLDLNSTIPGVRSVTVLPPRMGFGVPEEDFELRVIVDADSGVSDAVRWTSSDTTVARISAAGVLHTKCRATPGEAVITATSVADPRVRGRAKVSVWLSELRGLGPESAVAKVRECLERLLAPRQLRPE